jgi:UDP-3-O-[3-hydroxymyristoyl] glucosamine N-acyltransferase
LVRDVEDLVTASGGLEVEGGGVATGAVVLGELSGGEGVWDGGQVEAWGHLAIPGNATATGATDVHAEVEVLVPVDGTGEGGGTAQVNRQVAVGDPDTGIGAA